MVEPKIRPTEVEGKTYKIGTGCGNLYVTVNHDKDGIVEVFAHLGKTGQCGASQIEAICRSISVGLRSGVDVQVYVKQLSNIRCPNGTIDQGEHVFSCADGISKALQKHFIFLNPFQENTLFGKE